MHPSIRRAHEVLARVEDVEIEPRLAEPEPDPVQRWREEMQEFHAPASQAALDERQRWQQDVERWRDAQRTRIDGIGLGDDKGSPVRAHP